MNFMGKRRRQAAWGKGKLVNVKDKGESWRKNSREKKSIEGIDNKNNISGKKTRSCYEGCFLSKRLCESTEITLKGR